MCIEVHQENHFTIATITKGRLDASLAPQLKQQMAQLINAGNRYIILDLSQVNFMDSSGLGIIVAILKLLHGEGDLSLCGAKGAVSQLFRLTHMDMVFTIYPDVKQATNPVRF